MRGFRRLAAVTTIAGLLTGSAATAASAATSQPARPRASAVHVRGGTTTIRHVGGILFVNLTTGRTIQVSRFTINLVRAGLTGIVNGHPKARVPLFRLDLMHAKLTAGKHVITASGIGLKLTSVAAKTLNAALGTKLFSAGLNLGTARTLLRI